jgi:DNA repair ATPase RecN
MKKNIKPKKIKKGDGNNSLFDLAVGISMGDENHELEKRIQTITEELKKKDEIIEKLSKGGGGLEDDDFSKTVLQKLNTLQEETNNLQKIIENLKSSKGNTYSNTTKDDDIQNFLTDTLERINTLEKENENLLNTIEQLKNKSFNEDIQPVKMNVLPINTKSLNNSKTGEILPPISSLSSRKEKQRVPIS